jgi:serine/threonine protein kinase
MQYLIYLSISFLFSFLLLFPFFRLKDNTLETVKIADFGLSQFYRPGVPLKCDGSGTISTSAPELFVKNATYKSETYNLGKILA